MSSMQNAFQSSIIFFLISSKIKRKFSSCFNKKNCKKILDNQNSSPNCEYANLYWYDPDRGVKKLMHSICKMHYQLSCKWFHQNVHSCCSCTHIYKLWSFSLLLLVLKDERQIRRRLKKEFSFCKKCTFFMKFSCVFFSYCQH